MSQTGVYGTGARRAARRSGASGSDTQESLSSGPMPYISGKQAFLELLKQEGVSVMFGNPGTTELPLMDGLAREPAIHYVLALQEAVAIAMADGYAQASGGLAAANVHVSPGLGNAMGMLYDAMKSGAPLRSEEHTSELQSRGHLVCRLLLEKKKHQTAQHIITLSRFE